LIISEVATSWNTKKRSDLKVMRELEKSETLKKVKT